ncbi:MAG: BatD family protein [Gammaproteobacteria bacterium]|nr:BatD family protein [Gammaproteobacteria bacterium]
MKRNNYTLTFILSLLLFTKGVFATILSAHTEPSAVAPGEPFNFVLELDENAPAGLPDFGPLSYDFHIHGTAHSASYVFTNGQSKASTRWSVTLVPKHTGKITIPPIQVGQARSNPITLNIASNPAPSTQQPTSGHHDQALFIKTRLSDTTPLLNQQLIYTVKIFHYSSILDAAYQPPSLADALIIPIGNNQQHQVIENGRPYLVEEQKYAFFPQKTGTQILFPPKFQALIYDDIPRRAQASGDSASLDVKTIPSSFTQSAWLPAKAVSLRENYDDLKTNLTEGSTLTRTITLKATGLPAELLPQLELTKNDDFKIYPERPTLNNTVEGDNVVGSATIKINYLLNHPGPTTLPEQKIAWFNTQTHQKVEATLPARRLHITPDANNTSSATPTLPKTSPLETTSVIDQPLSIKSNTYHRIILHAASLLVFLLLCLLGFILHQKNSHKQKINQHKHLKKLKKACLSNQPQTTRDALLAWAKHAWPNTNILNLDDIIKITADEAVTQALHTLSKALYHPEKTISWQGSTLWSAIQKRNSRKHQQAAPKSNPLPPMNPIH